MTSMRMQSMPAMRAVRALGTSLILLAALCAAPVSRAAGDLVFNVTLDYDQDRDHAATQSVFSDLARQLGQSLGKPVKLIMSQNAERVGERIRTGSYAFVLAPAQIVGLAMRNGYTPVARSAAEARVVLVAGPNSGVTSFETAKGKRIALPHPESLVSYLIKGELNAQGQSPKGYFNELKYMNRYGATLYALEIGQSDVVAVKDSQAREWMQRMPGAKVVKTLPVVPLAGVAVNDKLGPELRAAVRKAFIGLDPALKARLAPLRLGMYEPAEASTFKFVSTRGFFSPEVLAGAKLVKAEAVKALMARGVKLYDVRPQGHYREAHIPGAINLPYVMNSPKEVDYDDKADTFDISRLPKEKDAPMIFQCNGAECWYSYKAARYMIKRGYSTVYWFRTGLPAWKAAGYPVQSGG